MPPGPRSALLSTFRIYRDPLHWYRHWLDQFGDPVTVPTLQGNLVLTVAPEAVKAVFSAVPTSFVVFAADTFKPFLGQNSVALTSGEQHRRDRQLLSRCLHALSSRDLATEITEICREALDGLVPGQRASMLELTRQITLRVILHVIFGAQDRERLRRFSSACQELAAALAPELLFSTALHHRFAGVGPYARYQRAFARFSAMVEDEIARRRSGQATGRSLLQQMLATQHEGGETLSAREMTEHIYTLLIAGYETTGLALAWGFYWVSKNPGVRASLCRELAASPAELTALPLLDAVTSEVLRCSPILPEVLRTLTRPWSLGGYELPTGTTLSLPMVVAHFCAPRFPDPDRFDAERFTARRASPFEYFPWGGGARRCLGAGLATLVLKVVLANLVTRYRFRLERSGEIRIVRHLATLWPDCGFPVVFEGKEV